MVNSMAEQNTCIVIGATGVVGSGIVRQLVGGNWRVVAISRDIDKLNRLKKSNPAIEILAGSVASDEAAADIATRIRTLAPRIDAVVTSINLPQVNIRLLDTTAEQLIDTIRGNLITHHCAARALIPLLAPGGRYVGIGGGMADYTVAGMGPVSLCQAAQRNMFRFFDLETKETDISIVELILVSMIVDPSQDATADPRQIRADEVGEHVRALLERADQFPGPILVLKSRKQVGQPENKV